MSFLAEDAVESGGSEAPWWVEGLLSAGGAYGFSILLSAALVLLGVLRFEPVLGLERAGIDLAMRVYVSFPTLLGDVPRVPARGYAFVDIDEATCRAFTPKAPDECGASKAAAPAAVVAVVDALRGSGAAVVVLDVAPPDDPDARRALVAALTAPSTPWLIAPIDGRPAADAGAVRSDPASDLVPPGRAGGRLWLAAFTTFSDPTASDGLVRHYPPTVRVVGPGGAESWMPTAPFLAAALAADPANAAAARAMFYCPNPGACGDGGALKLGERRFTLKGDAHSIALARAMTLDRITFSLPTLDGGDGEVRQADQYRGLYDRYAVSDFDLTGGQVRLPPRLLDGRIVVVGTSQAAGHDWHATPLGAMPGSEIVLNAARGFLEFAPSEQPDPSAPMGARATAGWGALAEKVWAATWICAIDFLPAALLIAAIASMARKKPWYVVLAAHLACAAVFCAALAVGYGLEVFEHGANLRAELREGRTVDLLSPVFGLGLEGYADASKTVLILIESALVAMAASGANIIGAVRRSRGRPS